MMRRIGSPRSGPRPAADAARGHARRTRFVVVSTVTTLALVAAAPGGAWAATGTDSSADTVANCKPATAFDRRDFSYPTRIDNKWLPLVPGTQYVLEGRANRGGGPLPHQVIFTVTDLTKVINGVQSRVIW